MSEYINELLKYINRAAIRKGTVIVVKIERLCGINRKCSWYIYKYMSLLEKEKIVFKWKKGTWIIEKNKVPLLESLIIELIPKKNNINKKRKIT